MVFIKGDRVAYPFGVDEYYVGKVTQVREQTVHILFDDGERLSLPKKSRKLLKIKFNSTRKTSLTKEQVEKLLPTFVKQPKTVDNRKPKLTLVGPNDNDQYVPATSIDAKIFKKISPKQPWVYSDDYEDFLNTAEKLGIDVVIERTKRVTEFVNLDLMLNKLLHDRWDKKYEVDDENRPESRSHYISHKSNSIEVELSLLGSWDKTYKGLDNLQKTLVNMAKVHIEKELVNLMEAHGYSFAKVLTPGVMFGTDTVVSIGYKFVQ